MEACCYIKHWKFLFSPNLICSCFPPFVFVALVLLPEVSFGLWVLSLPASLCVSVCPCVCVNHLLVREIAWDQFMLGSPNLEQRCKTPWLRPLSFWRAIDCDLPDQLYLEHKKLPHLWFVRTTNHHPFKLGSPNLQQMFKIPWLISLLICCCFLGWGWGWGLGGGGGGGNLPWTLRSNYKSSFWFHNSWKYITTISYTPSREYRVVRYRYSRLLFTSEDRLCANLRVQEQSTNMTSQCQCPTFAWRHRSTVVTSQY